MRFKVVYNVYIYSIEMMMRRTSYGILMLPILKYWTSDGLQNSTHQAKAKIQNVRSHHVGSNKAVSIYYNIINKKQVSKGRRRCQCHHNSTGESLLTSHLRKTVLYVSAHASNWTIARSSYSPEILTLILLVLNFFL